VRFMDNLNGCVGVAPKETCDSVFREVARFAREALTEHNRRVQRDQPGRVLLLHVPVAKRVREDDDDAEKVVHFCPACSKHCSFVTVAMRAFAGVARATHVSLVKIPCIRARVQRSCCKRSAEPAWTRNR
jgi:hypothetical protein